MPSAVPLDRGGLRPHATLLSDLAERLDDLERPVSAAGILGVRRLLTEPNSPLYRRTADGEARVPAVLRGRPRRTGALLMYDLAALAIAAACFAFAFALLWVLGRI